VSRILATRVIAAMADEQAIRDCIEPMREHVGELVCSDGVRPGQGERAIPAVEATPGPRPAFIWPQFFDKLPVTNFWRGNLSATTRAQVRAVLAPTASEFTRCGRRRDRPVPC
jgi:hypothetical protein